MNFDVTSFVLGVLLGLLATTAVAFPRVGRIVCRVLSAVAMAAGVGVLVWAIHASVRGTQLQAVQWHILNIEETGEALGWGVGLMVAGVTALVLSFIGQSSQSRPRTPAL